MKSKWHFLLYVHLHGEDMQSCFEKGLFPVPEFKGKVSSSRTRESKSRYVVRCLRLGPDLKWNMYYVASHHVRDGSLIAIAKDNQTPVPLSFAIATCPQRVARANINPHNSPPPDLSLVSSNWHYRTLAFLSLSHHNTKMAPYFETVKVGQDPYGHYSWDSLFYHSPSLISRSRMRESQLRTFSKRLMAS